MRRRTRVDLGQQTQSVKEETVLDRKRKRWAERNKDRDPEENPFLQAIRPDQEYFGQEDERGEELRRRLSNLEFGNFPGYFNYRNKASGGEEQQQQRGETLESSQLDSGLSDERLKFFQREWFHGKEVLDVGCNRGHITYAIARMFEPKSIVGIDIDLKMIQMANKDLHLHLEDGIIGQAKEHLREYAARQRLNEGSGDGVDQTSSKHKDGSLRNYSAAPLSSYISEGPMSAGSTEIGSNKFPNNIVFVEHNYVLSRDELVEKQKPYFDTIVCLSVTKWIHLNYCDSGLKRFFKRIYRHLKEDGLFILESQPFDNYGRRKKLSDRLRANFYSIQFKPDKFDEYLLGPEIGFKSIVYESVTDHQCIGFKRPLKVFLK